MSVPRKRVSKLHAPTSTPDNFPPHSTLLKRSDCIKDLKSRLGQQKSQNHCKGGPEGHHGIGRFSSANVARIHFRRPRPSAVVSGPGKGRSTSRAPSPAI